MQIRHAKKDDAPALARLINLAGEGIPYYLWSINDDAGGDPFKIGEARAARDSGGFSYTHARVMEHDNDVLGMVLSYSLDDPYSVGDLNELPEIVRPLVLLESQAPGSWYINAIATVEFYRGQGIASTLLADSETHAAEQGFTQASLIVASENTQARKLYLKLGYQLRNSLPVVEYPGCMHGGHWELMVKKLSAS
ncbi:GNAT family N-acetyltransferase [Saccharospirillum sp. MSK14-1]|uniref:GNAT family N-acetyltransferase n=1 Tax=Saccharospirillum sp. MSK14-1 TaxID=1897632 RepID=UPI000D377DB1|nr:GNAT family N-acetyltransferase [Saccharospirillum sp. MSK14-1]PTY36958.1 GNAT family N-acetyltransferase [Saccharospirillum sp. MSK14-1]